MSTDLNADIIASHTSDIGQGRGVYISTYGCQMNVNDTERMYSLLEMSNFVPVTSPDQASLIIINSCSVREKPVHKVRSEVGHYRNLKAKNPELRIGVTGCVAQQEKQKLTKDIPLLDFVVGTDAIDMLPQIVAESMGTRTKVISARFENEKPYHIETMIRNPGIATFVNIMKGCDNFCTFCIVPFTRGRERSRSLGEIVSDIKTLTKRGVKEVTLLGQNVNSYKSPDDTSVDFGQLLRALCEDTDIERIRYTSPHPKDFNRDLIELSHKYRAKICDYIHMPVQSGNTEILSRMNRNYTREEYLKKIAMIREVIPTVSLSTDMIVGFPGETEAQFEDTMSLIEQVRFESVYSFAYSPRPFTKAARFEDQVSEADKARRLSHLVNVQRKISTEVAMKYKGGTFDVLIEEHRPEQDKFVGRTTHNRLVYIGLQNAGDDPTKLVGQTRPVFMRDAATTVLYGDLVQ